MKLTGFQVRKFRSVSDSGWIECDKVTSLIGVNESGKSNLLLALWKLKPAKEGEIDLLADLPKESYATLRDAPEKPIFIEAEFVPSGELAERITNAAKGDWGEEGPRIRVTRDFDGNYGVTYPGLRTPRGASAVEVRGALAKCKARIVSAEEVGKQEVKVAFKSQATEAVGLAMDSVSDEALSAKDLRSILATLSGPTTRIKSSQIGPALFDAVTELRALLAPLEQPEPTEDETLKSDVIEAIPSFVYYANYGNLDAEIYLPHAIENLGRTDLSETKAAKTRTLRVLFEFVGLDAQEVRDKGLEPHGPWNQSAGQYDPPSSVQIADAAEAKKERDVLLHSASERLSREFRAWWDLGNYVFDLTADGDHFRIWVSDDERPSKVELENRSTGLQWFLSFFLVFLVESREAHAGTILLLDEAGLSLHPLAQRQLIRFLDNLAETNQLIHTTHSPFLVSTDHVDRVRAVYVDEDGYTVASPNLRAGEKNPKQTDSVYAVYAALGLSVSEALLLGCFPIVVEGTSDQFYLSAAKTLLVRNGDLTPDREIIFVPSGGLRGVTGVVGLLGAREGNVPPVLVDSDQLGKTYKAKLRSGLYRGQTNRVVEIADVLDMENAEVEDLFPVHMIATAAGRLLSEVEDEVLEDTIDSTKPVVPQIEAFAERHEVELDEGWKVDVARAVKQRLLQQDVAKLDPVMVQRWGALLTKLIASVESEEKAD